MAEKQKTLKASFTISGVGLHTGQNTKLTVHPAPIDHWYRFQRSDIEGQPTIKADVDFVIHTRRGTTLGNDKMEDIEQIEQLPKEMKIRKHTKKDEKKYENIRKKQKI